MERKDATGDAANSSLSDEWRGCEGLGSALKSVWLACVEPSSDGGREVKEIGVCEMRVGNLNADADPVILRIDSCYGQ